MYTVIVTKLKVITTINNTDSLPVIIVRSRYHFKKHSLNYFSEITCAGNCAGMKHPRKEQQGSQ
jgi:hypothetical protein